MHKGKTFILAGPSGVGKGTIIKKLFESRSDLYFSVSATTRARGRERWTAWTTTSSAGSGSWSGLTETRSWNMRSSSGICTERQRNTWTRPWRAART